MTTRWSAIITVLLLGFAIRLSGFAPTLDMLHHDEAWNGWRAANWLDNPALTLYYPDNTGQEGGWTLALTPFVALFGGGTLALRVAALLLNTLSLAAIYALGRELFGRRGAIWVLLAASVLYWHAHFAHIAFRANLIPLIGALALVALLRAYRHKRRSTWLVAGLLTGALAYTYTAAHGWTLFLLLGLIGWGLFSRERRGALIAAGVALGMAVPLWWQMLNTPAVDGSLTRTAVESIAEVIDNGRLWVGAWLQAGDPYFTHNLNERPIFDLPLALLALVGAVGLVQVVRPRWRLLLIAGVFGVSLVPSLLTNGAPHFLRGYGATVPVALLIGAGGYGLARTGRIGAGVALALFAWAGINSAGVFPAWLDQHRIGIYIDERVNGGMDHIALLYDAETPIVVPGLGFHPVAAYRGWSLGRDLTFYNWPDGDCFLSPRSDYVVLDLPIVLNSYFQRSGPYGDVQTAYISPTEGFNVYGVRPRPILADAWPDAPIIGDVLAVQPLNAAPVTLAPGDTAAFDVALRVNRPISAPLTWFVHLTGDPSPFEGGPLWATGDEPLCAAALSPERRSDQTLVQPLAVTLPDELPPGDYRVGIGLYDPVSGSRPPILAPADETRYIPALRLRVEG